MKKYLSRIDPRYLLMTNHALLLILGLLFYEVYRTPWQIILAMISAILVELLGWRIFNREDKAVGFRIVSALSAAFGILIFLISLSWWYYGVISAIAVASKYIIRRNHKDHVFNPTCFAIFFSLALFPDFIFVRPDQYNADLWPSLVILLTASIGLYLANRWMVALSYLGTVLLIALFGYFLFDVNVVRLVGPEVGTMGLLFIFWMLTDPRTSPKRRSHQALFGAVISVINLILRHYEVPYSSFMSLFLVTAVLPLFAPIVSTTARDRLNIYQTPSTPS